MCLLVYCLPPGCTPKLSMLMLKTLLPQFIRSIRATDPAIVLVDDTQITDMVRFCTSSIEFGILTVDPTFSLGEFDVTPITCRHMLLETKKNRNTPVFLGPVLVHYRKNFSTYVLFASTLVGLSRQLQGVQAFGTDGEQALIDALSHEFTFSHQLTCFIHVKGTMRRYGSHAILMISLAVKS